jgi:hypothetical protein
MKILKRSAKGIDYKPMFYWLHCKNSHNCDHSGPLPLVVEQLKHWVEHPFLGKQINSVEKQ